MMNLEFLRVSEVASRAQVSVDTVRYYDRKGLLRDVVRDANGYRRFPAAAVERILVIQHATAIGFTLDELVRVFQRRAAGQAPCGHVLESARRKLGELDERIAALQHIRGTLAEVIARWEVKFEHTPPGGLAYLLESLTGKDEHPS